MDIVSLINKCLEGDDDAWRKLVEHYMPIVFSQCKKFRLSPDQSNDIFGEVNYKILKNLENLKSKEKFLGYVKTITRYEILHLIRDNKTHDKLNEIADPPNPPEAPDDHIDAKGTKKLIREAFELLPARCQNLLNMVFFCDDCMGIAQIAKKLGRKQSSVRESVYRCLTKMKVILKKLTNDEDLLC